MVGFELLSQVQRDLTAEQAAQRLREMDKNDHYSQIKWSQKSHCSLVKSPFEFKKKQKLSKNCHSNNADNKAIE